MMTRDGQRIGPVSPADLLSYGLQPDSFVWQQDFADWKPASQVPELMALLAPRPEAPVPPAAPAPAPQSYQQGAAADPFAASPLNNPNPQSFARQPQPPYQQPYGQPSFPGGNNIMQKPNSYMVWAILSTVVCCVPFGIVSIVYANKVDSLWNAGKMTEAQQASDKARTWMIVSVACGAVAAVSAFFVGLAGS